MTRPLLMGLPSRMVMVNVVGWPLRTCSPAGADAMAAGANASVAAMRERE